MPSNDKIVQNEQFIRAEHKYKIAIAANAVVLGGVENALTQLLKNIDYDKFSVTVYGEISDKYRPKIPLDVEIISTKLTNASVIKQLFKTKRYISTLCFLTNLVKCKLMFLLNKKDWQMLISIQNYRYIPELTFESYDLAIGYTYLVSSIVGNTLYRINAKKKILWVHGESDHTHTIVKKLLDKHIYNCFDTIFCCSGAIVKKYKQNYPISGKKTNVFYNIFDIQHIQQSAFERFQNTVTCPMLVTVGRLSTEKGQQMIPATARLLIDAGYDIHWYLVGDGSLREEVEREIERYGVTDNVILCGTQMNPYPYIKNCNIYVQPSFSEGYCTTTLEAKILQKPIVTTDAPGMREQFVSGKNGLIVDGMTPEALFKGIKTLLDHPEICEKFVENLKNEPFDNSKEMQKLYDFIES